MKLRQWIGLGMLAPWAIIIACIGIIGIGWPILITIGIIIWILIAGYLVVND